MLFMRERNLPLAAVLASSLLAAGVAFGAGLMSPDQAHARAVRLLKGDPYGRTDAAVRRHIRGGELLSTGSTPCGPVSKPVWVFRVVVPAAENTATGNRIDGMLVLDAASGNLACANLPLLD